MCCNADACVYIVLNCVFLFCFCLHLLCIYAVYYTHTRISTIYINICCSWIGHMSHELRLYANILHFCLALLLANLFNWILLSLRFDSDCIFFLKASCWENTLIIWHLRVCVLKFGDEHKLRLRQSGKENEQNKRKRERETRERETNDLALFTVPRSFPEQHHRFVFIFFVFFGSAMLILFGIHILLAKNMMSWFTFDLNPIELI